MLNSPRRKSQKFHFTPSRNFFSHPEKFSLRGNKKPHALCFPDGEAARNLITCSAGLISSAVGVWRGWAIKKVHASRPNICHSCRLFGFTMNHPPLIYGTESERVSVLFIYARAPLTLMTTGEWARESTDGWMGAPELYCATLSQSAQTASITSRRWIRPGIDSLFVLSLCRSGK